MCNIDGPTASTDTLRINVGSVFLPALTLYGGPISVLSGASLMVQSITTSSSNALVSVDGSLTIRSGSLRGTVAAPSSAAVFDLSATVIELKMVCLEFMSLTRLRQPISTRDELAAMKQWLLGLSDTDVKEKLLISTHTVQKVITPITHLNDAFAQAVTYATGLLENNEQLPSTVVAIALVAIGPRVLIKAGRVML
jgi:hypothetical protein